MGECETCREDGRRCQACTLDAHDAEVERETIRRVVAWLRRESKDHNDPSAFRWAANLIERGDWKEDGDG